MTTSVNIFKPNSNFDFSSLTLGNPTTLQGQTFFSKLTQNKKELFIQTPHCVLKNGFVNSAKRSYCDLVFSKDDTNIIAYLETLETTIQEMIYARREKWFHDDIEMDDIENIFTSPLKSYKSGRASVLRAFLNSPRNIIDNQIKVYDEYDNEISMEELDENSSLVCILHITGLKFSSKLFQIYFEIKQIVKLGTQSNPFSERLIVTKQTDENVRESSTSKQRKDRDEGIDQNAKVTYELPHQENEQQMTTSTERNNMEPNNDSPVELVQNEEENHENDYEENYQQYLNAKQKAKEARMNALKMISEANSLKQTFSKDMHRSTTMMKNIEDDNTSFTSNISELSEPEYDSEDIELDVENLDVEKEEELPPSIDDVIENLDETDNNDEITNKKNLNIMETCADSIENSVIDLAPDNHVKEDSSADPETLSRSDYGDESESESDEEDVAPRLTIHY
jgi:hypothetical protein